MMETFWYVILTSRSRSPSIPLEEIPRARTNFKEDVKVVAASPVDAQDKTEEATSPHRNPN